MISGVTLFRAVCSHNIARMNWYELFQLFQMQFGYQNEAKK